MSERLKLLAEIYKNALTYGNPPNICINLQELVFIGAISSEKRAIWGDSDSIVVKQYRSRVNSEGVDSILYNSIDECLTYLKTNGYAYCTADNIDTVYAIHTWKTIDIYLSQQGVDLYIRDNAHKHKGALRSIVSRFATENNDMNTIIGDLLKYED